MNPHVQQNPSERVFEIDIKKSLEYFALKSNLFSSWSRRVNNFK